MRRSVIACPGCRAPLADRHHSGRVKGRLGVTVTYAPAGRHGPFLGLTCGGCGMRRDWTVGSPTATRSPAAGAHDDGRSTDEAQEGGGARPAPLPRRRA
ncbi:MAG: hypothetical protein AVDCRST_MAG19-4891 [uncultured Thermomicrobiales bacterium]|uniref:Uncharacterized protein n=1 Tax=uncultured Thermomicrobiales bacterium TaxID=1645740 RepID=A0A6J4VQQ6_9BACT|nr:MAG: hypothetical protein AVDCRST_MAG19-4891 [uncultured Thermomicrobiales bacterium]